MKGRKHHGKAHEHDIHGGHKHHMHDGGATVAALKHHGKYKKGGAVKGVAAAPSMIKRKRGGKIQGRLDTHDMHGHEGAPMKPLSGANTHPLAAEKVVQPVVDQGGKGGRHKRARGGKIENRPS